MVLTLTNDLNQKIAIDPVEQRGFLRGNISSIPAPRHTPQTFSDLQSILPFPEEIPRQSRRDLALERKCASTPHF